MFLCVNGLTDFNGALSKNEYCKEWIVTKVGIYWSPLKIIAIDDKNTK